jgi:hypothetical protein
MSYNYILAYYYDAARYACFISNFRNCELAQAVDYVENVTGLECSNANVTCPDAGAVLTTEYAKTSVPSALIQKDATIDYLDYNSYYRSRFYAIRAIVDSGKLDRNDLFVESSTKFQATLL